MTEVRPLYNEMLADMLNDVGWKDADLAKVPLNVKATVWLEAKALVDEFERDR